jgi:DNA polymerase (family 10)
MADENKFPNGVVAELLRDIAAAYQVKNDKNSRFKIIAYQRAADAVEHLSSEIKDMWDEDKLGDIPGVGPSIAQHLDELFKTGKSKHFDEVMDGLPPSMFPLMKVQGIGPKRAYNIATNIKISVDDPYGDLEKAIQDGKVAELERMGEETQKDILQSLAEIKGRSKRILLPHAESIANEIIAWMEKLPEVKKISTLGSLRRKNSTVGDIDISVATNHGEKVMDHFVNYPKKSRVLGKGEHSASIVVPGDIQVDLKVQPPEAYGSLLQHFTGSKHHNIALREYSIKKGFSLSEYGIKPTAGKAEERQAKRGDWTGLKMFDTEEKFYNFLGLDWIPPEIRDDAGEIEKAQNHTLPKLIELKDVKGDLQMHSSFDIETSHDVGASSFEELVDKANELGYEYIAVTEHNPSQSGHTMQQITDILKKKQEVVQRLNYKLQHDKTAFAHKGLRTVKRVFNSLEIDMLPSGKLPVNEKGLETLDFALISIHSSFRLPKKEMTHRILSAFTQPNVQIFAHPTGRLLNKREGAEIDWDQVFDFALKNNKWIEINADSNRLDLPDFLVHEAVKLGVKLTFGTDAHHKDAMDNMINAVYVARRGSAEKKDIVNTRNLEEFLKLISI